MFPHLTKEKDDADVQKSDVDHVPIGPVRQRRSRFDLDVPVRVRRVDADQRSGPGASDVLPDAGCHLGAGERPDVVRSLTLPDWVEGPLVYVWWEALGGYHTALDQVLSKIASSRPFTNYRSGKLGPTYLQRMERTAAMEKTLKAIQPGGFLIAPSQAGFRHRGLSTRCAQEVLQEGEFGLGAVAEGCRVLVRPQRFVRWEQLHVDCLGDKYAPVADAVPTEALFFCFVGKLSFFSRDVGDALERDGSASAVLPQELLAS